MRQLIDYFLGRPLLTNALLFGALVSAVLLWGRLGKEEMPDFAFNWLSVSLRYPGATAEDAELFVTKPIEENLKSISGLEEVAATSSHGTSSFRVLISPDVSDTEETIQEIKDAIDRTKLPDEVEDPVYRRFKRAEKAIIDIALYHTKAAILSTDERYALQEYALSFETQIRALPEVSGMDIQGYLQPELQILVDPQKLKNFDISLADVRSQLIAQHVRMPAGSLEDRTESEVVFLSELDSIEALQKVPVRGGFEGQRLLLGQIAKIRRGFERTKTIQKVQGHEAIIYNIKKGASVDILSAQRAVLDFVDRFKASHGDAPLGITLMDDESYDVRNRLSIISMNGVLGFFLISLVLFLFLDFKAGFWVATGIPFSLASTLIAMLVIGYTVNNVTLAAIIIVLGIVVDDAIVVAENIVRLRRGGMPVAEAAAEGTARVVRPVLASVLTTCVAFIPLYFIGGRMGMFVSYIPAVIFLMLGASLLESAFVLPGHMAHPLMPIGFMKRIHARFEKQSGEHWFDRVERAYQGHLRFLLLHRRWVLLGFVALLGFAFFLAGHYMNFVMFPREETKELTIRAIAAPETTRYEMAQKTKPLEDIFLKDPDQVVVGAITRIGQSRRGGEVKENEANLRVELLPRSERATSLRVLLSRWEEAANNLPGFEEIRFLKSRFGSDSGSPIEIEVRENSDERRFQAVSQLEQALKAMPALKNVEIERPVTRNEFQFQLDRERAMKLGISPLSMARSLRSFVEGEILYTLNKGDEEVDVRLMAEPKDKKVIGSLLNLHAANEKSYLVPYANLVSVHQGAKPANIARVSFKRTTKVYADLSDTTKRTPLELAEEIESSIFPKVIKASPSTVLAFRGEIEESRESQSDLGLAVVLTLFLIYIVLLVLFESLTLPLLIGVVIPFGMVGVILAFLGHGMAQYGFFSIIGTLGMIGVVVNDSIVMVSRLEEELSGGLGLSDSLSAIASICSTRLRAVVVTTLTTLAGLFPTAYGVAGYDSMLAEMMLAMGWGLLFGTLITLALVPVLYSFYYQWRSAWERRA